MGQVSGCPQGGGKSGLHRAGHRGNPGSGNGESVPQKRNRPDDIPSIHLVPGVYRGKGEKVG